MSVQGETKTSYVEVTKTQRLERAAKFTGKAAARLAICIAGGYSGGIAGGGNAYTTQTHVELTPGIEIGAKPVLGGTSELSAGPANDFPDFSEIPPDILAAAPGPLQPNKPAGNLDAPKIHTSIPVVGKVGAHAYVSGQGIHIAQLNSQNLGEALSKPLELVENPIVAAIEGRLKADFLEGALIGGLSGVAAQGLWALKKSQLLKNPDNIDRAKLVQRTLIGGLVVMASAESLGAAKVVKDSRITAPSCSVPFMPELIKQHPKLLSAMEGSSVDCNSNFAALNKLISEAVAEQNDIDAFYKKLDNNLLLALATWHEEPETQANLYGRGRKVAVGAGGFHCALYGLEDTNPLILSAANASIEIFTGNISVSADSTPPMQEKCADFAYEGLKTAEQASGHSITGIISGGSHDYSKVLEKLSGFPQPIPNANSGTKNAFIILDGRPQKVDGITFDGLQTPRINDWGKATKVDLSSVPPAVRKKLGLPTAPKDAAVPADIDGPSQNKKLKPLEEHNVPEIGLFWSGENLASSACSSVVSPKNFRVLASNSPEQSWQSAYEGCADMTLAGEGPAYDMNYVSPITNKPVFRAVQISAGGNGADCNLWPDETIDQAGAQYAVYSFDQANHTIWYDNITLHSDASVTISPWHKTTDAPTEDGVAVDNFLIQKGDIPLPQNANHNPNAC